MSVNINDDSTLLCPSCNGERLHLKAPTEYFRARTACIGRAVGIAFCCGDCGAKPELMLTQRGNSARLKRRGVPADTAETAEATAGAVTGNQQGLAAA
jgi:hypothetical protein